MLLISFSPLNVLFHISTQIGFDAGVAISESLGYRQAHPSIKKPGPPLIVRFILSRFASVSITLLCPGPYSC